MIVFTDVLYIHLVLSFDIFLSLHNYTITVSYTHLDVYKRQTYKYKIMCLSVRCSLNNIHIQFKVPLCVASFGLGFGTPNAVTHLALPRWHV